MGGDGGNDTQQVVTNSSRVESFLLRNGTYDWSRDHAGITFLKMAQQYAVPYITFFINAAPSHIAGNGASCGWNMTSNKVDAFGKYISTVLSHWTDQGMDVKYISPMNEPDNSRWDCGQERMGVAPRLREPVIKSIRSHLDASAAKSVDIIADETSQITTQAFPEDPIWLPDSAPYISNIAIHNYDYPSDSALAEYYQSIQNLTSAANEKLPPVKFTETCCSTTSGSGSDVFGSQNDPTIKNALIVARYIWQYLTIVQAESFDWWTAVANLPCSPKVDGMKCATAINNTAGYNSGLVYIDGNYNKTRDFNLYTTKRAFMLKHFAYFHRPGSVRFDVSQQQLPFGVNAVASKGDGSWSVLFMNNQTRSFDLSLAMPEKKAKLDKLVQTTNAEDWDDGSPLPPTRGGKVKFKLAAESLLTLHFKC